MNHQLHAGEPINNGVRRIACLHIDTTLDQMADPHFNRDDAVHEGRKMCKRIRAILRLIRNEIGSEYYQQENGRFRDASRLIAPARDAAVMVETLDSLLTDFEENGPGQPTEEVLTAKSFTALRSRLVQRHRQVANEIMYESQTFDACIKMIEAGRAQISQWPIENEGFIVLQNGLKRVYRRGLIRMAKAYANPDPEKFHDWRKRVKYLWHQVETLSSIWPDTVEPMSESLHTLSSLLGDDHDLAELQKLIAYDPNLLPETRLQQLLFELIEHRRQTLQTEARFLGERIYAEAPSQFVERQAIYWHIWRTEYPIKQVANK